jgi:hypothetical protein
MVASLALCAAVALMPAGVAGAAGGSGGGGGSTSTGGGGGGSTSTGGGGGGGGTKCVNSISVTASATESLDGNSFNAAWALTKCQSQTRVQITATDTQTGALVYASALDPVGSTAFWTLPYRLTTYRIDANAWATVSGRNTLVATGSATVATLDALPCTPALVEAPTVGFIGLYPAIWEHHTGQDCGLGATVSVRITNMSSGSAVYYPVTGVTQTIDYEGAGVPYSTPFHIQVEMHSATGDLMATDASDVVTPAAL